MAASAARLEQRQHATGTAGGLTVRAAVDAFLDSPKINRSPHTRRAYANVLDRTVDVLGAERDLAGVSDAELGEALTRLWGGCAESTWNRNRAAVGSWLAWCAGRQHWDAPGLPASVERRREVEDTMRITWGTDTAHLLPRLIAGRTAGPLFLSEYHPGPHRQATIDPRDICPETSRARLGYDATTGPGSLWVTTATTGYRNYLRQTSKTARHQRRQQRRGLAL